MTYAKPKFLCAWAVVGLVVLGGMTRAAGPLQDVEPAPEKAAPKVDGGPAEILRELEKVQAQLRESMDRMILLELQVQALRKRAEAVRSEPAPAPGEQTGAAGQAVAKGEGDRAEGEPAEVPVPGSPTLFRIPQAPGEAELLLVVSPAGDKVVAYDPNKGSSRPITLADDPKGMRGVTPVIGQSLVALAVKGAAVKRLAVLDKYRQLGSQRWHPIDLREPVGDADPQVDFQSVVYKLGRRIYAYSSVAERWDVLELPEGAKPVLGPGDAINCQHDGHIYTFVVTTGKWKDLDFRALLDAPEKKGQAEDEP